MNTFPLQAVLHFWSFCSKKFAICGYLEDLLAIFYFPLLIEEIEGVNKIRKITHSNLKIAIFTSNKENGNCNMNGEAEAQSSASEDGHADANGNLNNLGARPKIRLQQQQPDQVVPNEINDENDDNDENSDDDFYIYR